MYPAKLNQLSEVYKLGDVEPKYRMFYLELYHDVYALNDEVRDCILLFFFLFFYLLLLFAFFFFFIAESLIFFFLNTAY